MNDATPQAYTLEILAKITGVSSQTIVQYQEHGLIRPEFDDETVRALRRIEHLRETCEMNLAGLKLLTSLLDEVDQLREELRWRR
ncbi:chaperone modulator CbpM [Prosthecobacter sp.]|uniref:chaperone modulator CbpM n=1 Tax=Prosthecobacter sp. TaxID=1965333 RepID=UPI002AB85461|nr:chaperone modulator CbpM [Prosthecobacter sp.]MDZ4403446.1 chaperone modulator CbpM [Prosthecobacter sp.]